MKSNSLYIEKELNTLPDSPCGATATKVLCFDAIKDKFHSTIGASGDRLKSTDLFMLIPSDNEICFVEMKRFDRSGTKNLIQFAQWHLGEKQIPCKVIDSLFLLLGIAGFYKIHDNFYKSFFDPSKLTIHALFFSNFTPTEISQILVACGPELNIGLNS